MILIMANPIILKTGSKGVIFSLKGLDNSIVVDINPDGALPVGNGSLGWSRVLEMNTAGFAAAQNVSIDLSAMLAAYKSKGAKSVTLTVVVSNWAGPGNVNGAISWPGNSQPIVLTAMDTFTSTQFAYTLDNL
jgi:hypothetical protein